MQNIQIVLPPGLPADVCTEIAKRACYCDTSIAGCRYLKEERTLKVGCNEGSDIAGLESKLQRLIAKMKSQRLAVQPRTLASRAGGAKAFAGDMFGALCRNGEVTKEGIGVVARRGEFFELLRALDRFFERLSRQHFLSSVADYSVLIPSEWLRRAGYFASFPHSLTFATHLCEDYDRLEAFAERHKGGRALKFEAIEELTTPEFCLSPAVCYHTYGVLMGHRLPDADQGLKACTAVGRCFRYESKNITDLERLWEFTMREIVFVGERERVLDARKRIMDLIWRFVELFDLKGEVATASDPFFATDFNSLRFFQLSNELKFELQLPVDEEKSIACASFNYHETFFGSRFDIKTASGEYAHTACAAFGLERFAYACLVQLGATRTWECLEQADREFFGTSAGG
jgi:seryl-tRNA synthetase